MRSVKSSGPPAKYQVALYPDRIKDSMGNDDGNQGWTYEHPPKGWKTAVRQKLWEDQKYLCAYCERKLSDPSKDAGKTCQIEHFHPRAGEFLSEDCKTQSGSKAADLAPLKWTNLLLCCTGNKPDPNQREADSSQIHCDASKGNTDICAVFHNPNLYRGERMLQVNLEAGESLGIVEPVIGMPSGAQEVADKQLKLNVSYLVERRRKIIVNFMAQLKKAKIKKRGLTSSQYAKIAANQRDSAKVREHPTVHLCLADWAQAKSKL